MTNFPTTFESCRPRFKPDPEPSRLGQLIVSLFLGAIIGFGACVVGNSGGYWPVGAIASFVIYCWLEQETEGT